MRYCRKCVIPDTKPYIEFDADGVCCACARAERKADPAAIDWPERKRDFDAVVAAAASRRAPLFDAVVPVSGGKDSITQVHRLLPYGLRICAVHVDGGVKTEIGRRNLQLISEMGVTLFTFKPEQSLHRRLMRIGFEDFGDPDLLSHTLLHAFPLHLAVRFQVPLILLGENSAAEYGGEDKLADSDETSREWFKRYAANAGRDAKWVSEKYDIPFDRLRLYDYPDAVDADEHTAVFMSCFFPWDSEEHLRIARRYGFETSAEESAGTYRDYVGLDDAVHHIHQYLKVLKFGYGRATDHACEDIRAGRITREQAALLVARHDALPPSAQCLGTFAEYVGLSVEECEVVFERYREAEVWSRDDGSRWYVPGHVSEQYAEFAHAGREAR